MTTKPRLVKVYGSDVWQCRSPEFYGVGWSPAQAWTNWLVYMERHGLL